MYGTGQGRRRPPSAPCLLSRPPVSACSEQTGPNEACGFPWGTPGCNTSGAGGAASPVAAARCP